MSVRPNVVFVITDDQGYPPLGCHGHPFVQTPNLDAFHGESARFDQFHTGTTCAPTRAGLMTGHYCNSTGVWHTIGGRALLRKDEWSLADALSGVGYKTGLFGKWHLGDEYPYRAQDRGFQRVVCHNGGGIGQQTDYWGNDYFDDTYRVDGVPTQFEGYCTDVFFREAIDFIETNKENPFFCYISTNAPHHPFNVERQYRELYSEDTQNDRYARFLGMITNIDENFGTLRDKLRELDLEDNTIFIFMSDNGQAGVGEGEDEMYNSGMRGFKGTPYEGGHRVPFFIRWPDGGISTGNTIEALTSYVDFMPTILDLCGVEVPPERSFHGESLRPLLEGTVDAHWAERIITTDTQRVPHPLKWRLSCVMKDSWRLVNRTELYHLANDPGQTNDIASENPDVVKELQEAYDEWWTLCATQMNDDVPLSIGAVGHDTTVLRGHDLRDDKEGTWLCLQRQVRGGAECHGWWEILVEQEGDYEFELRRWPEEVDNRLVGAIEGDDVIYNKADIMPGFEVNYSGSKELNVDTAGLFISGMNEQWKSINPDDHGVIFRVHLPAGPRHLRARFSSSEGFNTSAYYVHVRRVG